MSTRIDFYHLLKSPLEQALPQVLEKAFSTGARIVVRGTLPERLAVLNEALWTHNPGSWLPHGTKDDGDPAAQPIYLTLTEENPNGAKILVLIDGAQYGTLESFERCLIFFNGHDPDALGHARAFWKEMGVAGHERHYWQQNEKGSWSEKVL